MQRTIILFICLFCLTISYSQSINQFVTNDKGNEKLLGKINREGLTSNSFNVWYSKNYDDYLVNDKVIEI